MKNGVQLQGSGDGTTAHTLHNLSNPDEGVYSVVAVNSAGYSTSLPIVVQVLDLPVFVAGGGVVTSLLAIVGEEIVVSVNATGDPTPSLIWSVNNVTVANQTGNTLRYLTNDSMVGELLFVATATNVVGATESDPFLVLVERTTTTTTTSVTTSTTTTTVTTSTTTTTTTTVTTSTTTTTTTKVLSKVTGVPLSTMDASNSNSNSNTSFNKSGCTNCDDDAQLGVGPIDPTNLQTTSTAGRDTTFAPIAGSVLILLAVGAALALVVQRRRTTAAHLKSGIACEYGDENTEADALIIAGHMKVMQDHLQQFFVERETDGGGIHDIYELGSMTTVAPRQISPRNLILRECIGKGQFGEVFNGDLKTSIRNGATGKILESRNVAIKSMKKTDPTDRDVRAFLGEGVLMAQFNHPNIIRLVGISISSGSIQLVTELASKGSLQRYLQKEVATEPIRLQMAVDICDGMQYLEHCGFIHRDLAARNVLVAENLDCKIADFGLSRRSGLDNSMSNEVVAVRWTAPEVIRNQKFSRKTDVWSFGVVMYEVWTRAALPYGSGWTNVQVLQEVDRGYRLPCPEGCDQSIYVLMMSCWHPQPALRPSFAKLKGSFKALILAWQKSAVDSTSNDMQRLAALYQESKELAVSSPSPLVGSGANNSGTQTNLLDRLARLELEGELMSLSATSPSVPVRSSAMLGRAFPGGLGSTPSNLGSPSTIATPNGLFRNSRTAYGNMRESDMLEEPDEVWNKEGGENEEMPGKLARFSQRVGQSFKAVASVVRGRRGSSILSKESAHLYLQPGGARSSVKSPDEATYGELPPEVVVHTIKSSAVPEAGECVTTLAGKTIDNADLYGVTEPAAQAAPPIESAYDVAPLEASDADVYLDLSNSSGKYPSAAIVHESSGMHAAPAAAMQPSNAQSTTLRGFRLEMGDPAAEAEFSAMMDMCVQMRVTLPVTGGSSSDSRHSVLVQPEVYPVLRSTTMADVIEEEAAEDIYDEVTDDTLYSRGAPYMSPSKLGGDTYSGNLLQPPVAVENTQRSGTVRLAETREAGRKAGVLLLTASLSDGEPTVDDAKFPTSKEKEVVPMVDSWERLRMLRSDVVAEAAKKAARKAAISRIHEKYQNGTLHDSAVLTPIRKDVHQTPLVQTPLVHPVIYMPGDTVGMRSPAVGTRIQSILSPPVNILLSPVGMETRIQSILSPSENVLISQSDSGQQIRGVLSPLSPNVLGDSPGLGDVISHRDTVIKSKRKGKGNKGGNTRHNDMGVDSASARRQRKQMVAQLEGGRHKDREANDAMLNTIAKLERPDNTLPRDVVNTDSKRFELSTPLGAERRKKKDRTSTEPGAAVRRSVYL
jgi:serine/threonine protein kinase